VQHGVHQLMKEGFTPTLPILRPEISLLLLQTSLQLLVGGWQ